ncbi:MAG: hypothetical protein IEMM0002_0020 [bacterium]|nr:MAG: hypothetical protein IEMM0002_0020 [bacterium]
MALIDCPECKNKISDNARSCPNCGQPLKISYWENISNEIIAKTWDSPKAVEFKKELKKAWNSPEAVESRKATKKDFKKEFNPEKIKKAIEQLKINFKKGFNPEKTKETTTIATWTLGIIGLAAFIIIIGPLYGIITGNNLGNDPEANAIGACERTIRISLVSPDSASFDFIMINGQGTEQTPYLVSYAVKAQNRFGVVIKQPFVCHVVCNNGQCFTDKVT